DAFDEKASWCLGWRFARKAYPEHDEAADDEEDIDARGTEGGQPIRTLPGRSRAQGFLQRVMQDDEDRGDTPQNLNAREPTARCCQGDHPLSIKARWRSSG